MAVRIVPGGLQSYSPEAVLSQQFPRTFVSGGGGASPKPAGGVDNSEEVKRKAAEEAARKAAEEAARKAAELQARADAATKASERRRLEMLAAREKIREKSLKEGVSMEIAATRMRAGEAREAAIRGVDISTEPKQIKFLSELAAEQKISAEIKKSTEKKSLNLEISPSTSFEKVQTWFGKRGVTIPSGRDIYKSFFRGYIPNDYDRYDRLTIGTATKDIIGTTGATISFISNIPLSRQEKQSIDSSISPSTSFEKVQAWFGKRGVTIPSGRDIYKSFFRGYIPNDYDRYDRLTIGTATKDIIGTTYGITKVISKPVFEDTIIYQSPNVPWRGTIFEGYTNEAGYTIPGFETPYTVKETYTIPSLGKDIKTMYRGVMATPGVIGDIASGLSKPIFKVIPEQELTTIYQSPNVPWRGTIVKGYTNEAGYTIPGFETPYTVKETYTLPSEINWLKKAGPDIVKYGTEIAAWSILPTKLITPILFISGGSKLISGEGALNKVIGVTEIAAGGYFKARSIRSAKKVIKEIGLTKNELREIISLEPEQQRYWDLRTKALRELEKTKDIGTIDQKTMEEGMAMIKSLPSDVKTNEDVISKIWQERVKWTGGEGTVISSPTIETFGTKEFTKSELTTFTKDLREIGITKTSKESKNILKDISKGKIESVAQYPKEMDIYEGSLLDIKKSVNLPKITTYTPPKIEDSFYAALGIKEKGISKQIQWIYSKTPEGRIAKAGRVTEIVSIPKKGKMAMIDPFMGGRASKRKYGDFLLYIENPLRRLPTTFAKITKMKTMKTPSGKKFRKLEAKFYQRKFGGLNIKRVTPLDFMKSLRTMASKKFIKKGIEKGIETGEQKSVEYIKSSPTTKIEMRLGAKYKRDKFVIGFVSKFKGRYKPYIQKTFGKVSGKTPLKRFEFIKLKEPKPSKPFTEEKPGRIIVGLGLKQIKHTVQISKEPFVLIKSPPLKIKIKPTLKRDSIIKQSKQIFYPGRGTMLYSTGLKPIVLNKQENKITQIERLKELTKLKEQLKSDQMERLQFATPQITKQIEKLKEPTKLKEPSKLVFLQKPRDSQTPSMNRPRPPIFLRPKPRKPRRPPIEPPPIFSFKFKGRVTKPSRKKYKGKEDIGISEGFTAHQLGLKPMKIKRTSIPNLERYSALTSLRRIPILR